MGMYRLWLDLRRGKGNPEEGIEPGTRWEDVPMIGCVQNVVLVKKILI